MTAERIAQQLHGRKFKAGWMARCPAHDDRNPSLAIRQRCNSVLVHCHAGCEQDRVINVLKSRGLWQSKSEWLEWRDGIHYHVTWGRPVRESRYTDENGRHLYSIVRFEPKDFKPLYQLNGK